MGLCLRRTAGNSNDLNFSAKFERCVARFVYTGCAHSRIIKDELTLGLQEGAPRCYSLPCLVWVQERDPAEIEL
jgi:hypothetical protein